MTGAGNDVPLAELEDRLRPGKFSQAGFLGWTESLTQVLDADAYTLTELGVSAGELAEHLQALLEDALATKQTTTSVGHHRVRITRYKGPQLCPFALHPHDNPCQASMRLASIDWDIRNTRNGVRLVGPGLIAHLVGAHQFFEGVQSPYRVDPRALAELLELGPFAR